MTHFAPFFRRVETRAEAGRREMHLRGLECGRERERYVRASERRVHLRNLPASEVPCWNQKTEATRIRTAPSLRCLRLARLVGCFTQGDVRSAVFVVDDEPTGLDRVQLERHLFRGRPHRRQWIVFVIGRRIRRLRGRYLEQEGLDARMQQHSVSSLPSSQSHPVMVAHGEDLDGHKPGSVMHRYLSQALPSSLKKSTSSHIDMQQPSQAHIPVFSLDAKRTKQLQSSFEDAGRQPVPRSLLKDHLTPLAPSPPSLHTLFPRDPG